ncbi:DUF3024 domain-containing protein [Saccharospirillum impatiens]|uniref:DUF3024 domain-containing protein n=1 Tax=Saccharospirillum impatiens TaxID=169438 RepID=UPI000427666D|nr:DUF3024 domain-containing protein [Saccharospirillum impatiens]
MESSLVVSDALPEFVHRQAQVALDGFLADANAAGRFQGRFQKQALLIQERQPHPLTRETVLLPMALLHWREASWRLYFRGSRGRWQRYPGVEATVSPAPLLARVHQDELGLFWRQ